MAKRQKARLADVIGLLNQFCPASLAEDWDNVGLQVGDPQAAIDKLLICLDAEEAAVDEALRCGAQLIISHHPLIFKPLKRLTPTDMNGRTLFRAIKNDIAVVSAHTNLDRVVGGLNDWLAEKLHLKDAKPLESMAGDHFYKLIVYVPMGHETAVMEALFSTGAGHIGSYDRCSFRTVGIGSFRGDQQSKPFIGDPGDFEETEEVRLETIVPRDQVNKTINRMIKAHPYEEVAYDLVALANRDIRNGLGRIGRLDKALSLAEFAEQVKSSLSATSLRFVGTADQRVAKVAVCGGSGMSTYADAVRQGADCLVTGDIRFHEAQRARAEGVALIDAGHFATEHLMISGLTEELQKRFEERHLDVDIVAMTTEQDPFVTF